MSILGGITGGGAGFVMTPLMIFFGFSPAQAVSTGKINGLTATIGALGGMHRVHRTLSRRRVGIVMALAFGIGLVVPFLIVALDSEVYRIALGIILLLMVPVLYFKKIGITPHRPTPRRRLIGGGLLTLALFLQGAFGGGLGSLVNVVLMSMLGMTAAEANATKRWSQLVLNITVAVGVLGSGLIVWQIVIVSLPATILGGYLGGHLASRNSNQFVMNIMMGLLAASGLALIFGMGGS